jgi:ABC-2 family transporter
MTTQTLAAAPTYSPRAVPWRRLLWVTWRRYRTTLAAVVGLLALVSVYLVIRGNQMRTAYAAAQACRPRSAASCRFAFENFHNVYANVGFLGALLIWVPAVIGSFAGAPLLARELETGTFRFAWTQGVGRLRWLVAHLVPATLGVAVTSGAFGALVTWYDHPLVTSGIEPRLHTSEFPLTGVAVVGWALVAYALGVLVGLVSRRVVPALAVTLGVWTGLAFLAATVLRGHYRGPLVTRSLQLPGSDLPVRQWWTHGGVEASGAQLNQALRAVGVSLNGGGNFQAGPGSATIDPVQYLLSHGYIQWTSYQPDSRYWPFQWIEFGWLAGLSLALLAIALWMVRRRAA